MTSRDFVWLASRCDEFGECLLWRGACNSSGNILIDRRSGRRVAYECHHGEIPAGQVVYSKCGNKRCIGRECLAAGTWKQAIRNAASFGAFKTPAVKHSRAEVARNARSKLTLSQAREIRAARASGRMLKDVAQEYGVTIHVVSQIALGQTWVDSAASVFNWRP